MGTVTTTDGVQIYYKDWGPKTAPPIVFHHGWPLSADDWDTQMLFFLKQGYRVIAHDRRGHGRSNQVGEGHDMDHYAADVAAVVKHLDLRDVIHVGHSTGGGEATRYVARHGPGRVAKLVLIGAVPPIMVKLRPTPAAYASKCSMVCGSNSPPTVRNSTSMSLVVRFMDSTDQAPRRLRASSRIGGGKA